MLTAHPGAHATRQRKLSRKPRERDTFPWVSGSDSPPDAPAPAALPRCPRCGGATSMRRNRAETRNPFLPKGKKPEQLTCEDCGLDFDMPIDSTRESGRDSGRESGRSPWSKP
jgi:hypothetical protein